MTVHARQKLESRCNVHTPWINVNYHPGDFWHPLLPLAWGNSRGQDWGRLAGYHNNTHRPRSSPYPYDNQLLVSVQVTVDPR